MSSESLSSALQKFELNGDGDDRKMSKEFVSALQSLNAAPAAGRRSMDALSDSDIRAIVQAVDADGKDGKDGEDGEDGKGELSPTHRSGAVGCQALVPLCRSYGDASDGSQVPLCLKG